MLSKFAWKSLLARKVSVCLTVTSITISVLVLLAIQHIKSEAKTSFTKTVSGVDLIVGARTGQLNLLLYSVFRIGNATNNIGWDTFQNLSDQKEVAWTIPISLGDSHKGFRVLGTNESYFEHFLYANKRKLGFNQGQPFADTFEAVIGAEVANKLGYYVGEQIILAHGIGSQSISEHKNNPFTVVGILAPTGTPVDQTVHVPLAGIEAIHIGWKSGIDLSKFTQAVDNPTQHKHDLIPKTITAFMVGLTSKLSTFSFQRKVNKFEGEPLLAILPGIALTELWRMMGTIETILMAISWLVLIAALIGLSTMMLATIRERRQEFLVLRAIGASPFFIFILIQFEALLIVVMSIALAIFTLSVGLWLAQDALISQLGLNISVWTIDVEILLPIGLILAVTIVTSSLPAISAYKASH